MKIGWMLLMASVAAVGLAGCQTAPSKAVEPPPSGQRVAEHPNDISSVERNYVATHRCELIFHALPETKLSRDGNIVYSDEMKRYRCEGIDEQIWVFDSPAASLKQEPR